MASSVRVLDQAGGKNWWAYHGDCVEVMKGIPNEAIGYIIYSPPFEDLYTYSNSERDIGNCSTSEEFYEHFRYCVREQFRILKPGRNVSIHVSQIPATLEKDGWMGLKRCKDKMADLFEEEGFITYDEKIIWKDPVVEQQRTKALGLLHKQIIKDSARSRSGLHDYLVTFQKPGKNPDPVAGCFDAYYGTDTIPASAQFTRYDDPYNEYSIGVWQRYASSVWTDLDDSDALPSQKKSKSKPSILDAAQFVVDAFAKYGGYEFWKANLSPVWFDVNPSDTIDGQKGRQKARDPKDEKHVCPLQLTVIRRALQLYSNLDDYVLTPFGGIGSEAYCAVEMGRKAIAIELKASYFKQLVGNMKEIAGDEKEQLALDFGAA